MLGLRVTRQIVGLVQQVLDVLGGYAWNAGRLLILVVTIGQDVEGGLAFRRCLRASGAPPYPNLRHAHTGICRQPFAVAARAQWRGVHLNYQTWRRRRARGGAECGEFGGGHEELRVGVTAVVRIAFSRRGRACVGVHTGRQAELLQQVVDRRGATLFSFEWKRTSDAIDFALRAVRGQAERVFVGGIAATLMFDEFRREPRWAGVRFIKGLLDLPPALSLELSAADGDFGADDLAGTPIEELVPDYSILKHIPYTYPVRDAYFGYASRGCVRKCSFCGVPKLEGGQREMPPITSLVEGVNEQFGPKKDLILMDNNVAASARYQEVVAEIRDLGFERGATFERSGAGPTKRRVDFNQGVDARILSKTPMYLKEMATICIDPLRIAFDHVGMRRVYEQSVEMAAEYGLTSLSNYMLYNFMDAPSDLYQRMIINIELNERLGVRIWSFPMRYLPVNMKDRSHVGKKWNRYFLRSFQIMLQATHGVVSGSEEFFKRAFGDSYEEFERLLALPHAFIFQRDFYENGDGRPVLDEYLALQRRLSPSQQTELIGLLSQTLLRRPRRDAYRALVEDRSVSALTRQLVRFHAIDTKAPKVTDIAQVFPELTPDHFAPGSGRARRRCRPLRARRSARGPYSAKGHLAWSRKCFVSRSLVATSCVCSLRVCTTIRL